MAVTTAQAPFAHQQQGCSYADLGSPTPPSRPPAEPRPPLPSRSLGPPPPKAWHRGATESALLALVPGRTVHMHSNSALQRRRLPAMAPLDPVQRPKREASLPQDDGASSPTTPARTKQSSKARTAGSRTPHKLRRHPETIDEIRSFCQKLEAGNPSSQLQVQQQKPKWGLHGGISPDFAAELSQLSSQVSERTGAGLGLGRKSVAAVAQSQSSPVLPSISGRKSIAPMRRDSKVSKSASPQPARRRNSNDESQSNEKTVKVQQEDSEAPTRTRARWQQAARASVASRRRSSTGKMTKMSSQSNGRGRRKTDAIWVENRHGDLVSVFRRLQQDGEVHIDNLKRALELLAFVSPDEQWIKEVLENMTRFTTLSFEELIDFVVDYRMREELAGAEFFAKCDQDHSGLINLDELAQLLSFCSMFPMRHVLENIAMEVTELPDVSGDEVFSYDDFRRIFDTIKGREGFTKADAETYRYVFLMFDHDHSGDMNTRELMSALGYLGFALPRELVVQVANEVDVDNSGTMRELEFLKCIRKVHEREIACMRQMFDSFDADGSNGISGTELHTMLRSLGYYPTNRAIKDAAEDAGIMNLREELSFEDLWRLCEVYRRRDGLTRVEAQEIEDIFNLVDNKKTGELPTSEVARMFRVLGYPITFEVARKLTDEVDVNGSGKVDLAEFKKIVRKFRERDTRNVTALYKEYGETPEAARRALKAIGLEKAAKANLEFADLAQLAMFVRKAREKARSVVRAQSGFTAEQSMDLLRKFKEHDADGSGDIAYKELRDLLMDLFPHVAASAEKRPQLRELVAAADEDKSGTLDFGDFVRLVRQWRDLEEKDRYQKEETTIRKTGFTPLEVYDFRELFMGGVKERARLNLKDLEEMLSSTIPLGHKNLRDLKSLYDNIVTSKPHEATNSLDFPEFLLLMRQLIEMNFAGMGEFR